MSKPIPVGSRDVLKLEISGQNLTGSTNAYVEIRDPTATAGVVLGTASATIATASGTGASAFTEVQCTHTNWHAVITASGTYQLRARADYTAGDPWYSHWRNQKFAD